MGKNNNLQDSAILLTRPSGSHLGSIHFRGKICDLKSFQKPGLKTSRHPKVPHSLNLNEFTQLLLLKGPKIGLSWRDVYVYQGQVKSNGQLGVYITWWAILTYVYMATFEGVQVVNWQNRL
jgi:hypothetical protein